MKKEKKIPERLDQKLYSTKTVHADAVTHHVFQSVLFRQADNIRKFRLAVVDKRIRLQFITNYSHAYN